MNDRILATLEILTTKVRCLRREQVERLWLAHTKQPAVIARQYLRRLERVGLVSLAHVMAPPELELNGPLLDWRPGDREPNFDRLAWQAEARLAKPAASTILVTAAPKAQALTGGPIGSRPLRRAEIVHDLIVAGVFEKMLMERPAWAASWTPEDWLVQESFADQQTLAAESLPDAVVKDAGEPVAVEIIGRYGAGKLRAIHQAHAHGRYQLW